MNASLRKCVRLGAEPRPDSPTYEVELAVKAAQEDVCAVIEELAAVILFSGGHWRIGTVVALLALAQRAEAFKWSFRLRVERGTMVMKNGGAR